MGKRDELCKDMEKNSHPHKQSLPQPFHKAFQSRLSSELPVGSRAPQGLSLRRRSQLAAACSPGRISGFPILAVFAQKSKAK